MNLTDEEIESSTDREFLQKEVLKLMEKQRKEIEIYDNTETSDDFKLGKLWAARATAVRIDRIMERIKFLTDQVKLFKD